MSGVRADSLQLAPVSGARLGGALNPLSLHTPKQWFLASSAVPDLFPDSLPASCGTLAPSGCVHATNPSRLPGVWPLKPEPQLSAPTCPSGWADKSLGLVSAGQHRSSVWESLCFALHTPVAELSFEAPNLPLSATPCLRPRRAFPPSQLPPRGAGPIPILLSLFFILPYPGTWGISCLWGSLRSSASV